MTLFQHLIDGFHKPTSAACELWLPTFCGTISEYTAIGRRVGHREAAQAPRAQGEPYSFHSVPGRGTSFRVLLCVDEQAPTPIAAPTNADELRGSGTVLVINDEELIRKHSKSVLVRYGYDVLLARDGAEGIQLFQEEADHIGLVLLDVAAPGLDGSHTLERIREINPIPRRHLQRIRRCEVEARFAGKQIAGFFPKPYTVAQLPRKVKECRVH